jgi:hypothetical protein
LERRIPMYSASPADVCRSISAGILPSKLLTTVDKQEDVQGSS